MARKKIEETPEEEDILEEEFEEETEDLGEEEPDSDDETEADEGDVVAYEMGEEAADEPAESADDRMAGLAADVPVQVVAVLGKRSFNMKDLMQFHVGQVVDLYRPANETVDLVVGGKLIAKGELVLIDGKLGVRIVKLI